METMKHFLDSLLEINPKYDVEIIGKAYQIADNMHQGQLR